MRDFELVDQNLRVALRFFGTATGSGQVHQQDGSQMVYSGLDYGVFNIAMLTESAGPGDLERRIADCARYYQSRAERWSFWLCEELLDFATRRRARQAFGASGLRVISQPPGMLADGLQAPLRKLPEIECRPVREQGMRDAFAAITSVCFDIPFSISQAVYRMEQAWKGPYQGYVGLVRGKPVSIVAVVAAAGVLGVYSLATSPECRRCGYGEAVLRAAIAEETARSGQLRLVLQSTEIGYRLYRRLGFRDAANFTVFLTK
jgi:ribosomal protein S18 acetylase RimI-like enzyme